MTLLWLILTLPTATLALETDKDQPIEVAANSAERDEKLGITLYHGDVVIKQGSLLIKAETVTIKNSDINSNHTQELEEIITVGNPSHLQQITNENGDMAVASAKSILYRVPDDRVTLIDGATLKQAGRVISGERIIYDIAAQQVVADGERSDGNSPGRVKVVIPGKATSEN